MHTAGQLLQIGVQLRQTGDHLRQPRRNASSAAASIARSSRLSDTIRCWARVVQIAFETASRLVGRGHDAGPGRGEFGAGLGIGDRRRLPRISEIADVILELRRE